MKKTICLLAILAAVSACVYPYSPELEQEDRSILVVEGDILLGGPTVVNLRYLQPLNTSSQYYKTTYPSGTAWVEDESGNRYPSTSLSLTETALSLIIPTESAPTDRRYRLVVEADGETYVSDWLENLKAPTIKDIRFHADDETVYVTTSLEEAEGGNGLMAVNFDETWRFHADYGCMYSLNTNTWEISPLMSGYPYYWCWKSVTNLDYVLIDGTEFPNGVTDYPIWAFSRYHNRNHERYSIEVQARSLSEEEYRYRKTMVDNSETGGDLFSPNPGELTGNLRCESNPETRVLGYVSACEVSSKRAYLSSVYLLRQVAYYDFVIPDKEDWKTYYERGWYPVDDMNVDDQFGIAWGPLRCINCIAAGGTQERPDFWED